MCIYIYIYMCIVIIPSCHGFGASRGPPDTRHNLVCLCLRLYLCIVYYYYTIVYYAMLYYTVLYCTVLYCTIVHYSVL